MKQIWFCWLGVAIIVLASLVGYGMNIAKLARCDFEAPVKAETVRVIGIFVAPVGIIAGYMDIDDEQAPTK